MTTPPENSTPATKRSGGPGLYARQMAIAMELPFALVGPVLVAGVIGYFVDRWLGSAPWALLVMTGFGFFAGVRELLRRMKSLTKPQSPKQAPGASVDDADSQSK